MRILQLVPPAVWLVPLAFFLPDANLLSAASFESLSPALATVRGVWVFANREGKSNLPARHFLTEVCDADAIICDGNSLVHTDMNGNFALDTTLFGGENVRVKLIAWSSWPLGSHINNVSVNGRGLDAPDGPWVYLSEPFSSTESKVHQVPFTAPELPAFWIMDDFTEGMLRIPPEDQELINVEANWGHHYTRLHLSPITVARPFLCHGFIANFPICDEGRIDLFASSIRVGLLGEGLPNRVPLHEMGHAVQYYLYGQRLPAPTTDYFLYSLDSWTIGPCSDWDPALALEGESDCAWQEGFAEWWQLYVQNSPIISYSGGGSYNYEDIDSSWDQGDETPGRITGALWDMYDVAADGTDASDAGFDYIWEALKSYSAGGDPTDIDRDFADFWATWRARYPIGTGYESLQCAVTAIYQNAINYDADGWLPCASAYTTLGLDVSPGMGTVDVLGYARVPVSIGANGLSRVTNQSVLPAGGIGAFENLLTYDTSGIEILGGNFDGTGFTGSIDLRTPGTIRLNGVASQGVNLPATLAFLFPRLTGSALSAHALGFSGQQPAKPYTYSGSGTGAGSAGAWYIRFKRGDARPDGRVNIADALFIAQYLAGTRPACNSGDNMTCTNTINAASVKYDGPIADRLTIDDARVIAEYTGGIRDEFYYLAEQE